MSAPPSPPDSPRPAPELGAEPLFRESAFRTLVGDPTFDTSVLEAAIVRLREPIPDFANTLSDRYVRLASTVFAYICLHANFLC